MTESKSFNRVSTVVLTLLVILAMLPIILIVIASFSGEDALIRDGYTYFPAEWSLDSYYYMVKQGVMILRAYGVSFFVTFFGTALSVLLPIQHTPYYEARAHWVRDSAIFQLPI